MGKVGYWVERGYPYVLGAIAVFACIGFDFNMRTNSNYKEVLNGLITLGSIIIGFLGAVLPAVLSMKNESKFVRYVFEHDTENLFAKYLKATITLGFLDILVSLIMHVRNSLPLVARDVVYYLWIFITIAFIVATYRSMSHVITLIFSRDDEGKGNFEESKISNERKRELENEYKA